MADGNSNKEIATALGISERTVKTHLGASVRKARRHQPHRGRPRGDATRAGQIRLMPPGSIE